MARPWVALERVATPRGELELRRRGAADYLITLAGRVVMTSAARRSEEMLGARAAEALEGRRAPRVLLGGLGMGFTLRAALDRLPVDARVHVAELNREVIAWCRGPLAPLTAGALSDPRVEVAAQDVVDLIAHAALVARRGGAARLDAIVLDLYEGPRTGSGAARDPVYGERALARARAALAPGGVLAVWGEAPDRGFERRLASAGFRVARQRAGRGGRRHAVYLALASGTD